MIGISRVLMVVIALLATLLTTNADAKKKDAFSTWNLNVQFVVGVEKYDAKTKAKIDTWIARLVARSEQLYSKKPSLKINATIVRKTHAGGKKLSRLLFDSGSEYGKFMDANFDTVATSKTEGYLQVLVAEELCVGWDKDPKTKEKVRHCIGGRATFPHWVTPFDRKHGITILYPDNRDHLFAHELGHHLALKHTFEAYVNVDPKQNCNTDYKPKGEDGHCASCKSGVDMKADTCAGAANVMDYCTCSSVYVNDCQADRAASQRLTYMTTSGQTNYYKMKGLAGDPACAADSECASGEYCDKGTATIGRNQCKPKLADGNACSRKDQCSSGSCNVRCYTPSSKNMGQSCNINAECKAGQCSGTGWGAVPGKCVCNSDSHCSSGQYCYKGVASIGTNVCKSKLADGALCTQAHQCSSGSCNVRCYTPSSKNMGQSCNISAECKAGKCSGTGWGAVPGKCVCDSDGDCGSGKYCNKGVVGIGTNVCKSKLAQGKACTKGHQCSSGCCKLHNFKLQCRPSNKCN